MTTEEAHRILSNGLVNAPSEHEWCMAFRMAIKALEQEPCEDCISRQAAIRIAEKGQVQGYEWHFKQLCGLPSVTPSRPKGKWISETFPTAIDPVPKCPFCNKRARKFSNFCPNCGAKMEESEDKK